jgi:uncharacterized RDD family membrane protein YckC
MERNFNVEQLATRGIRFTNFIIDLAVIGTLVSIIGNVIPTELNETIVKSFGLKGSVYGFAIIYCTFSEWLLNGKTVGKYFTKTRAIKNNGSQLTFFDAFFRSLLKTIPLAQISCTMNAHGYGWHDKFTKTIVIPDDVYKYK